MPHSADSHRRLAADPPTEGRGQIPVGRGPGLRLRSLGCALETRGCPVRMVLRWVPCGSSRCGNHPVPGNGGLLLSASLFYTKCNIKHFCERSTLLKETRESVFSDQSPAHCAGPGQSSGSFRYAHPGSGHLENETGPGRSAGSTSLLEEKPHIFI